MEVEYLKNNENGHKVVTIYEIKEYEEFLRKI